ncbi:unnamed protein product [Rotaria socialis]|uniref:G-protein coupled receptors family 1 profile domain-containing protein n=1 Tax=Rotaria socialis TaxID=392032 RepID=A0A818NQP1_9BILA|nr:unnamed protein product [Rotaria socialis]CAF4652462.1 unnamed protein product [Rotaria socialis]
MSNDNATSLIQIAESRGSLVAAYYALILVIIGTLFNIITFIVLCRSTFKNVAARPILHYMRAMAIFDILMLYGWNLDHYVSVIHGFQIQTLNIPFCKFLSFLNYFASQSSAWLRVFVSFDRYLSLSRLHRTWFSQPKNVLIIITSIMIVLFLLNFQFFLFECYYTAHGSITSYSLVFQIYPLWDYINLGVYNCAPFILMVIFNSGVICHLFYLRRTTTLQNSRIQQRPISITLVITTFMFLFMTIPSTVGFAFFSRTNAKVLYIFDALLYTYHILSFPLYVITFDEFRQNFVSMITYRRNNRRIIPVIQAGITPKINNFAKPIINT